MTATLGLPPELLVEVFPFHLWLDPELAIVQLGSVITRVLPDLRVGGLLVDHFALVRPRCAPAAAALRRLANQHFLLEARGSSLRLRGQMLPHDDGSLLFLGWPWVGDVDELTALGLELADFRIHNPMTDQLWMIRSIRATLDDTRKLAERLAQQRAQLLDSRLRIDLLLRHTPLAVIDWDLSGRIAGWNPAAAQMFGIAEADAIGRDASLLAIVAEPEEHGFAGELDLFGAGEQRSVLLAHALADATIQCEWSNTPLVDGAGQTIGVASIVRDVTAARRAERVLREAHRLESVGLFAGGFAHDFNNLLAALLGDVDLALLKCGDNREVAAHLEQIAATADRAAALTRQLLHYAGRGSTRRRPVDFNELVAEAGAASSASLAKHVSLQQQLGKARAWVNADVGQLHQVVINLVVNAAEAIGDRPGTIELRTKALTLTEPLADLELKGGPLAPGPYVKLEVRDDGEGIAADALPRIFEPFYSTKFTGRGLGLAATLSSIRGHDGGIRVTSSVGQGTTFELWFPALG